MNIKYADEIKKGRYSVYLLINPINNSPFYVGYTSDPNDRYKSHINKCQKSVIGGIRWKLIQEIQSVGLNVQMLIIETYGQRGKAMKSESKIIKEKLNNLEPILNGTLNNIVKNYTFHVPSLF